MQIMTTETVKVENLKSKKVAKFRTELEFTMFELELEELSSLNTMICLCTWVGSRPVAGGGGEGQCDPQPEIKLKSCPTKTKFALVDFSYFYRSHKRPWFTLKWQCLFQEKTIISGYICRGFHVNMCMANKVFVVVKFTHSLIFLCLL